jgi:hypothetical protein
VPLTHGHATSAVATLIETNRRVAAGLSEVREQQQELSVALGLLSTAPPATQINAASAASDQLQHLERALVGLQCQLGIAALDATRVVI